MTGRKCFCLLFLVFLTFLESDAQPKQPFFRNDYTYIPTTENFYKIHHTHQRTWLEARKRCEFEGATLFYPETDSEAHDVISFWNRTQSVSWVYIGISDLVTQDVYETIDGRPIKDVYNNWGAGEPNNAGGVEDCVILRRDGTLNDDRCDRQYPFICKKTAKSVQWNKECNMPNPEYVYNEALGHCYKFHELPTNWTEALSVCSAEQSYLAIINSKAEDEFFVKMTKNAKKDNAPGLTISGAVYLGFHNRDGGGWRTIKGQPLADTGFGQWTGGQPDGGTSETCGSMFFTGELNDIGCHHRLFYICEHDVQNPSGPLDERFNYLV